MDNGSEKYKPGETMKNLHGLLKDYSFKLEGLSDECERSFIHIIEHLGGKVSKNAKYTLVEKSYYNKDENKNQKDFYHLYFILDCIDFRKVPDIEKYRCDKTCDKNKENSPSILQKKSENNNGNIGKINVRKNLCNQSDSDDVPIQKTIMQSKLQNNEKTEKNISNVRSKKPWDNRKSDSVNNTSSKNNKFSSELKSDDNVPISERINQSKSQGKRKILTKKISKVKVQIVYNGNDSDTSTRSNFSIESNSDENALVARVIKNSKSQNNNNTLNIKNKKYKKRKISTANISNIESSDSNESVKTKSEPNSSQYFSAAPSDLRNSNALSINSKSKKRKISTDTRSDSESCSSSESVKIKSEQKSPDSSENESYSRRNTLNKNEQLNKKNEASSNSDEITNYESDSESLKKKEKKYSDIGVQKTLPKPVLQNKTNSKPTTSTWVDTKNLQRNQNKNNKDNNEEEDLDSDSSSSSKLPVNWSKTKIEERKDLEWLFHVDKNHLCNIKKCSFEPGPHNEHSPLKHLISKDEKLIILKYIIKNEYIPLAKGIQIWKVMNKDGYLTHRTPESLRNSLRRVILPGICSYGLPVDILDQLLALDERKEKGHSAYAKVKQRIGSKISNVKD